MVLYRYCHKTNNTAMSSHKDAVAEAQRKRNLALIYGREEKELLFDPDKRTLLRSKPKFVDPDAITKFEGDFAFLAPEYCTDTLLAEDGVVYPSFEHALQASRVESKSLREIIKATTSVREAKRVVGGNQREGWKDDCLKIADKLLRDKFTRNKNLRKMLMDTKQRTLIYHNTFGDVFWGVNEADKGMNHLGLLLERIRGEIASDSIDIKMIVSKGDQILQEDCKIFEKKTRLLIGKDEICDIVAEHPTVSRSNSLLLVDHKLGVVILDLGSANGTFVDGAIVGKPYTPISVGSESAVSVGASKRQYRFVVDYDAGERRKLELYSKIANPLDDQDNSGGSGKAFDTETTVFVGKIPQEASERDVRAMFESCGPITRLSMPLDKHTNAHRGIAFITFINISALLQAVSRDGDDLLGSAIRVKRNLPAQDRHAKPGNGGDRHAGASGSGGWQQKRDPIDRRSRSRDRNDVNQDSRGRYRDRDEHRARGGTGGGGGDRGAYKGGSEEMGRERGARSEMRDKDWMYNSDKGSYRERGIGTEKDRADCDRDKDRHRSADRYQDRDRDRR